MQPLVRGPGLRDDPGRRTSLSRPQRVSDEGMMAVMPRGFDYHSAEVRVAGLGDRAAGLLRPARMLRGNQADEGHETRRRGKPPHIAELGCNRERRQVIDPAEAAQALDTRPERLELE
jgi:hypothetical protein